VDHTIETVGFFLIPPAFARRTSRQLAQN